MDPIAQMNLQEKITDMVMQCFVPQQILNNADDTLIKLMRSGVSRDCTENILKLVEDYYIGNNQETAESPDKKAITEVCALVEEWHNGDRSDMNTLAVIEETLKRYL